MNSADIELVRQPIPNMDKIYAVLDQIEAEPDQWDQGTWGEQTECGTTMCFAGWACTLEGQELDFEDGGSYLTNGEVVSQFAETTLGLTPNEADDLFLRTISRGGDGVHPEPHNLKRARHLHNVKVEIQKISARAKEQRAAFERVAKELIASVPELEAVIEPGYLCPESRDTVLAHIGGQDGGN